MRINKVFIIAQMTSKKVQIVGLPKIQFFRKYKDLTTFHADPKLWTNGQYFSKEIAVFGRIYLCVEKITHIED